MIKQASFPQEIILEDEDPIFEINECVTSQIKDMPQEIQDRINSLKGSRRTTQKRFGIKNKVAKL